MKKENEKPRHIKYSEDINIDNEKIRMKIESDNQKEFPDYFYSQDPKWIEKRKELFTKYRSILSLLNNEDFRLEDEFLPIIEKMLENINYYIKKNLFDSVVNKGWETIIFKIVQIKLKFNQLRVYCSYYSYAKDEQLPFSNVPTYKYEDSPIVWEIKNAEIECSNLIKEKINKEK